MGNTHVFSAPVLAYRPKLWSETWQQRHVTLREDSTLHVSHGAHGKSSYTINLKLLSSDNIFFGRRQIRSFGAASSKPFPTDLYMDMSLNCLVDIDRSLVIYDPTENSAQNGDKSNLKDPKFHAISFSSQKDFFRFISRLSQMGLFRDALKEAVEHQPLAHATAFEQAISNSGGGPLKNLSIGKGFSISEISTVILVVIVFLWILKYLLWTTEEDI